MQVATKAAQPSVSTNRRLAHVAMKALRRVRLLHLAKTKVSHRVGTIRFSRAEMTLAMIRASRRVRKAAINRGRMSLSHRALSLSMQARLTALQRSDLLTDMPLPMHQPVPTKALAVAPRVARPKALVASSQRAVVRVDSAADLQVVQIKKPAQAGFFMSCVFVPKFSLWAGTR